MYAKVNKNVTSNKLVTEFLTDQLKFKKRAFKFLSVPKLFLPLPPSFRPAQMAESVDALVSNTSGFISMPVRPRLWVPFKTPID